MISQRSQDTEDTATFSSSAEESRDVENAGRDQSQVAVGPRMLGVKNPAVAKLLFEDVEAVSDDTMSSLANKPELLTKVLDQVEGKDEFADMSSKEGATAKRVSKLLENEMDENMGGGNYYARKGERKKNYTEEREVPGNGSLISESSSQLSETVKAVQAVQALRKAVASKSASISVGSFSELVNESDTMSQNHSLTSSGLHREKRTRNGLPPLPKKKNGGIISRFLKKATVPMRKVAKSPRIPFARHDKYHVAAAPSPLMDWSDSYVQERERPEPERPDDSETIKESQIESDEGTLTWDERFHALSQQIESTVSEVEPTLHSKPTPSLETREEDGETTLESRQDSSTAPESRSEKVKSGSISQFYDKGEISSGSSLFSPYSTNADSEGATDIDEDTKSARETKSGVNTRSTVETKSREEVTSVGETKSGVDTDSFGDIEVHNSDDDATPVPSEEFSSVDEIVFTYSDASSDDILQTGSTRSAQFSAGPFSLTEALFRPTESEVEDIKDGGSAFYDWLWGKSGPFHCA